MPITIAIALTSYFSTTYQSEAQQQKMLGGNNGLHSVRIYSVLQLELCNKEQSVSSTKTKLFQM